MINPQTNKQWRWWEIVLLRPFTPSARLFLLSVAIYGISLNCWSLLFNLFFLQRGFTKDYLGLLNSFPFFAPLLFGIPLGMLSDRIGRRKALITGLALYLAMLACQVMLNSPFPILAAAFIGGLGYHFFNISQAPFLMGASDEKTRELLFSFTFGLVNLIGAAGTLLAGQLPGWFSALSRQPAQSAIVYQQVMLATLAFGALALIPVFFIKEKKLPAHADQQKVSIKQVLGKGVVWRLVLPYLLLGVGSSNFYTYMNVFFTERFSLPSNSLGLLFGAFAILAGLGSLLSAKTAEIIGGKVRTMVVAWCLNLPALMLMAFGNNFGLAASGFLLRAITFNMATPLFSSFAMEQIHQREQGTVNSLLAMAWTVGSATGPYLSVKLQNQWGFTPVFGVTTVLTVGGALILWAFFGKAQRQIPGETELKIG